MLPRARPVMMSWTYKLASKGGFAALSGFPRPLLHGDRYDLPGLPDHHDVGLVSEGVVLLGREGPLVGLDEALVLRPEVLERVPDLGPLGAPRLLDGQRHQVHAVVGVGRPHGRDHVLRALDAVLVLEHAEHGLT